MTEKCFNPEIYALASAAGATDKFGKPISSGVISFTQYEFQDFMVRYARYIQARQRQIVSTYKNDPYNLGHDAPSQLLIQEVENSLFGEF